MVGMGGLGYYTSPSKQQSVRHCKLIIWCQGHGWNVTFIHVPLYHMFDEIVFQPALMVPEPVTKKDTVKVMPDQRAMDAQMLMKVTMLFMTTLMINHVT